MPIAVLVRRVPPRRHGLGEPAPLSELWPRRLRRRLARRPCRPALRRDRPSHRRRDQLPAGGPLVLPPRTTGLTPTLSAEAACETVSIKTSLAIVPTPPNCSAGVDVPRVRGQAVLHQVVAKEALQCRS